jgi:hypothetical protein
MAPSAGGGEIPGCSRGNGNFADFPGNGRFGGQNNTPNQALAEQFP